MLSKLTIVHRKKPNVFPDVPSGWDAFVTCLRSLAINFDGRTFPDLIASDEVFRGEAAYRFLLEVVCGLQSPILGETEVFGQFRRFAGEFPDAAVFYQNVFSDVKAIRQKHLSHLGSQSYGSWVRKQTQPDEAVHVLGTGQLATEILVWLMKQNSVTLYGRSPLAATERLRRVNESVQVCDIKSQPALKDSIVVIAAPMSGAEIQFWLAGQRPRLVIDLRDDSNTDKIEIPGTCFRLHDLFAEIQLGRIQAQQKVQQARTMIDAIVTKRFTSQLIRPFGWDDLCA